MYPTGSIGSIYSSPSSKNIVHGDLGILRNSMEATMKINLKNQHTHTPILKTEILFCLENKGYLPLAVARSQLLKARITSWLSTSFLLPRKEHKLGKFKIIYFKQ